MRVVLYGTLAMAMAFPWITGCAAPRHRATGMKLTASTTPVVEDIPVPERFELVDQASEDWSDGTMRYLRHRYHGAAGIGAVRRFFQEQMPLVRWTPISDSQVYGRITMRFERAHEACTVTIEDDSAILSRRTIVDVIIVPRMP